MGSRRLSVYVPASGETKAWDLVLLGPRGGDAVCTGKTPSLDHEVWFLAVESVVDSVAV
jgi:hypothetical protein